jgi:hypothetical protein
VNTKLTLPVASAEYTSQANVMFSVEEKFDLALLSESSVLTERISSAKALELKAAAIMVAINHLNICFFLFILTLF